MKKLENALPASRKGNQLPLLLAPVADDDDCEAAGPGGADDFDDEDDETLSAPAVVLEVGADEDAFGFAKIEVVCFEKIDVEGAAPPKSFG